MGTDEMSLVRELRADAPAPGRADLAGGRQRLTEAAGHRRGPRADWRLAAVASAAAITMAAVIGTQLTGGGQGTGVQQGAPASAFRIGAAAPVLRDAAAEVADDQAPAPRTDQWVYTKDLEIRAQEDGPGEEAGGPRETEHWYRYADPESENGKSGDDHSARERFQLLAGLPSDPAQVKKRARAFYPGDGETAARHEYRALTMLAMSYPADPKGIAAVYRAMATVPGLTAVQTQDALNRPVIGVQYPGDRDLFLLDAQTMRFAGWGSLDSPTADGVSAVLKTALVDRKGARS
ncbi:MULTISPECIES: CU044_5270 family protein [unclassified Streptomyces]|uniref:CU044_5270 family protein n=1 Tax=unclassified Streptomyces TaxID=2593676 RepID=UPI002251367F|nr:CU044_5270 family protein [Streptomyces sp. NBC_00338]MCX5139479.1 CU044_5270 family protein [Streptomyces sp. NBC_00338]WSU58116.1 CU044_5270 family protein [Streptomyces sp. NBC_01104]